MARKCTVCRKPFKPVYNTLQRTCGDVQCAIDDGRAQAAKKYLSQTKALKKEFREKDLAKQKALTQAVFNKLRKLQEIKWFKERGIEPYCISCGKTKMDWCCGHYKTVASQGNLRFDERNTYLQCNRYCNSGKSGNIEGDKNTIGYKKGLIERFGETKGSMIINYCENHTEVKKWTCDGLIKMRKEFNKQKRDLEND